MSRLFHKFHRNSIIALADTYNIILTSLKIENFGYLKIYKQDSKYFYLTNDSIVAEEYINTVDESNIFFKECLSIKTFANKEWYYVLWPEISQNHSMDIYLKNQYWNGLSLISQDQNFVEIWWVALAPNNERIRSLYHQQNYRNNFLILVDYFNKQLINTLKLPTQDQLPCYDEGFKFSLPNDKIDIKKQEACHYESKKSLLQAIYPKNMPIQSKNGLVKLTYKEIKLLKLLSLGNQTKQIAIKLGNAPKTIEHQKAHIKFKTGYTLNSDLVKLYNDQIKFIIAYQYR